MRDRSHPAGRQDATLTSVAAENIVGTASTVEQNAGAVDDGRRPCLLGFPSHPQAATVEGPGHVVPHASHLNPSPSTTPSRFRQFRAGHRVVAAVDPFSALCG